MPIFITRTGMLKLMDFGFAKSVVLKLLATPPGCRYPNAAALHVVLRELSSTQVTWAFAV